MGARLTPWGEDPEDAWEPDHPDTTVATCESCHAERPCRLRDDPYLAELYPEDDNPLRWWCGSCWHQRKDDV